MSHPEGWQLQPGRMPRGYRFCYRCGVPGGGCGCNPGHGFVDQQGYVEDRYVVDAPIRDGNGVVDLGSCILRRKIRRERKVKRSDEMDEETSYWYHSMKNAAVCTFNGRRLFSSRSSAGSISMLTQQLSYESISVLRQSGRRKQQSVHADTTWLFLPRGADVRAMQQFHIRDAVQLHLHLMRMIT